MGFPKIRDTVLGVPIIKTARSTWGSILGFEGCMRWILKSLHGYKYHIAKQV